MKKIVSLLVVLLLVWGVSAVAFAGEVKNLSGEIQKKERQ